jgi:hypothetical protein
MSNIKFEERDLLIFSPFYFKNGNTPKRKFFIVLKVLENQTLIAILPTSKNHIPAIIKTPNKIGCIEAPEFQFNCFYFPKNISITSNGFKFDLPTFIYGHQIDNYDINILSGHYESDDNFYKKIGKIKKEIFKELIDCLKKSSSVKRKYKKIL